MSGVSLRPSWRPDQGAFFGPLLRHELTCWPLNEQLRALFLRHAPDDLQKAPPMDKIHRTCPSGRIMRNSRLNVSWRLTTASRARLQRPRCHRDGPGRENLRGILRFRARARRLPRVLASTLACPCAAVGQQLSYRRFYMATKDLDSAIERSHAAVAAIFKGDSGWPKLCSLMVRT